ncbi:hypothetical protein EI94DRAFT_1872817 [Lactarius quietus]|nr:hypothetical protein EI94DRAFT_1872817 [Lactarius quietus]
MGDVFVYWRPGDLGRHETWWAEHQEALEATGYMLRAHYHPGWTLSWCSSKKPYFKAEDGLPLSMCLGIDATQISDGKPVMFKWLLHKEGPYELQINRLFSTVPLTSNPQNHCVPLLNVIQLPNDPPILVHPMLHQHYDPPIRTIREFITFFAQICEGVKFMHEHHVAHRSLVCSYLHLYDPANGPPLDKPLSGEDKSAPEHQDEKTLCNPFPTDVYYLGNLKYHGLEFMQPLIADMVQEDLTRWPNMDEVVSCFAEMKKKLGSWKLGSQMACSIELWPVTAWRSIIHWYHTIGFVLAHKAAIPEPK